MNSEIKDVNGEEIFLGDIILSSIRKDYPRKVVVFCEELGVYGRFGKFILLERYLSFSPGTFILRKDMRSRRVANNERTESKSLRKF